MTDTLLCCYRFVTDSLTSSHGQLAWRVGEWVHVQGKIVCCVNGLHASLSARDSLRSIHGERWFIAEARGTIVEHGSQLAASEMRLVEEIPSSILRRFAIWCARDCLTDDDSNRHLVACLDSAEAFLDSRIEMETVAKARSAVTGALSENLQLGAAVGRATASAIAASLAAVVPHPARWTAAAVANAYAAHAAVHAIEVARSAADAISNAFDAVAAVAAARAADRAAVATHTAASAAGTAHTTSVAAAQNVPLPDRVDPYATALDDDQPRHPAYAAQAAKLLALIDR